MRQALGHILDDFVSAVLFVVAYGASGSLRGAIGIATLAALTPAAWSVLHRRRVEPWQWSSLGLSLALGAAAWCLGSPRFIMAKPSAVHLALAAAMSRGDWLQPPAQRGGAAKRAKAGGGRGELCLGRADGGAGPHQPGHRLVFRPQSLGLVRHGDLGRRKIRRIGTAICRVPDAGASAVGLGRPPCTRAAPSDACLPEAEGTCCSLGSGRFAACFATALPRFESCPVRLYLPPLHIEVNRSETLSNW